ncbi:MAG TPA: hypothetical protein VMZ29_05230 [Candidatus Bathyarchaeia archaeon]|nr:hypothetical protein [Candidatus Bathyarchaeia archaeon]
MDWAISNYTSSLTLDNKNYWGKQIQAILYDDLPSVVMIYPMSLLVMDEHLIGYDALLWENSFQTMENWSIVDQAEFHYAIP